MIRLDHVSKQYQGLVAVDNISFEVADSEKVVLLGTSGCGKTTTLRMINRLTDLTTGKIMVNGQDIAAQEPELLRRRIGYVLQHNGLFPHYTIFENIAVVPNLLRWEQQRIASRVKELMDKLQLPETLRDVYPAALSGGQQQRVGLARALASDPSLLLMDEPFGALDPVTRASIRKEFKTLDELKRKTMIMVTHDVQEAFELADRICLMHNGKIEQIGTPAQLLFNPASQFVSGFFGGYRFQLELESIRIGDMWSLLPKAIDGVDEKYFLSENSLWNTIETMSQEPVTEGSRFVSLKNGEKKQVDIGSLMSAYSHFKTTC